MEILLAELAPSDAEWLRQQRNRPELMQWFRQEHAITSKEQKLFFKQYQRDRARKTDYIFLPQLVTKSGKERIGYARLHKIDRRHGTAEFAIFIVPEYQRRGHGEQSLRLLLDYGFRTLKLRRIYSDVIEGNKSLKLFKKVGFQAEGMTREAYMKNGSPKNAHAIGLLADEYLNHLQKAQ